MLAQALLFLSLEPALFNAQRTAAAAVAKAAIKFMRCSREVGAVGDAGRAAAAETDNAAVSSVCASVVAQISSQQLLLLFEELLVMMSRELSAAWQRALLAIAQNLCSHISSQHDAARVLLLLLYPPPSIDSFALLDACFVQLLSICPQVTSVFTANPASIAAHLPDMKPPPTQTLLSVQECSQLLATRMVEHVASASSILVRLLDAAAAQPSLVPALVKLVQARRVRMEVRITVTRSRRICSRTRFVPAVSTASSCCSKLRPRCL